MALLVHALLVAALTWGVGWKRDTSLSVEAELWAAVPQEMAPVAQPAPPEPAPPTPPEPKPEPTPEPVEPPTPPPPSAQAQAQREAEINLEREREEQARKAETERKARLEREQKEKEREQKERDRKLAEEKRRKEDAERRERAAAEQREQQEQQRQENIRRMMGLADATPQPNAAGQALRTAGPSATYAGRIRARIKPNIVFPDNLSNTNISAEVRVSTSPDGAVTSRTLTKSSGNRLWDEAVLRAIDKTAILPKDTDGKVPPELIISFTPRD
jgi:colicin import membrane protein